MSVALTWLGQSGFVLDFAGVRLAVDPFLSDFPGRRVAAPATPHALAGMAGVVVTHEHADHFDVPTLHALQAVDPSLPIVLPEPLCAAARGAGLDQLIGAQPGMELELGGVSVRPVSAQHGVHVDDAYDFGEALSEGLVRYLGYVIAGDTTTVFHAGDTLVYEGLGAALAEADVDIALLPINGRDAAREARGLVGNMTHAEAAQLAAAAGVRYVIPTHFDMFDANSGPLGAFVEAVRETGAPIGVLCPAHGRRLAIEARASDIRDTAMPDEEPLP